MNVANFLNCSAEAVFPFCCLVCGRHTRGKVLCASCVPPYTQEVPRCKCCFTALGAANELLCSFCKHNTGLFKSMRYLWDYQGKAQALIAAMKYKPSIRLCYIAASLLGAKLPELYSRIDWELIVAVPSSKQSRLQRMFNQCDILAGAVAHFACGVSPIQVCGALRHRGYKELQASVDHKRRFRNVKNAFYGKVSLLRGARILLVDDVITTGATSSAAALALYKAGASSVHLLALARSAAWQEFRAEAAKRLGGNLANFALRT